MICQETIREVRNFLATIVSRHDSVASALIRERADENLYVVWSAKSTTTLIFLTVGRRSSSGVPVVWSAGDVFSWKNRKQSNVLHSFDQAYDLFVADYLPMIS